MMPIKRIRPNNIKDLIEYAKSSFYEFNLDGLRGLHRSETGDFLCIKTDGIIEHVFSDESCYIIDKYIDNSEYDKPTNIIICESEFSSFTPEPDTGWLLKPDKNGDWIIDGRVAKWNELNKKESNYFGILTSKYKKVSSLDDHEIKKLIGTGHNRVSIDFNKFIGYDYDMDLIDEHIDKIKIWAEYNLRMEIEGQMYFPSFM